MLSVNVICAVHVLLELDKVRDCQKKADCGLFPHEFSVDDELRRPVLRRVLRTLQQAGYITVTTNKKYTTLVDTGKITLLNLVRLFHGGVCLGEVFDHYMSIGREGFRTPEYRNLMRFETRLSKDFSRRLEMIHLCDFRRNLRIHRITEISEVLPDAVVNE